jgi:hypothetical protein
MTYDNVPASIIRRAFSVWMKNNGEDIPVLYRVPDSEDEPPFYLLNWMEEDQDSDAIYMRYEQLAITCVDNIAGGVYGVSVLKTRALDFFQREHTVNDCNKFIEYMVASGETVPYRFKSFEISSSSDDISWFEDELTLQSPLYIRYGLTFGQENLPNIQGLTNVQIASLDT